MNKAKTSPEEFIGEYWGSVFQNAQTEWVWNNAIKILFRTGNQWRELPWDEYILERKKDAATDKGGGFDESEKSYFEKVLPYTVSAEMAAAFTKK